MMLPVLKLAVGLFSWCAWYDNLGGLRCIGSGSEGLGQEDDENIGISPGQVESLSSIKLPTGYQIGSVHIGLGHVCLLPPDNSSLLCFGRNDVGQLGLENTENVGDDANEMGDNMVYTDLGTEFEVIRDFSTSRVHNCAISTDRRVKCWGWNNYGQLGFTDKQNRGDQQNEMGSNLPFLELGEGFLADRVFCGDTATCVVNVSESIKCFGLNEFGQIATGQNDADGNIMVDQASVTYLGEDFTIQKIASAFDHACFLSTKGQIKCTGSAVAGALGYGDSVDRTFSALLPFVDLGPDFIAMDLSSRSLSNCALSQNMTLKCWGSGNHGRLGNENVTSIGNKPNQMGSNLPAVNLGTGFLVESFALGGDYTCALSTNNQVKCWGRNAFGQLGQGNPDSIGDAANEMGDFLPAVPLPGPPTEAPSALPTAAPFATGSPSKSPIESFKPDDDLSAATSWQKSSLLISNIIVVFIAGMVTQP